MGAGEKSPLKLQLRLQSSPAVSGCYKSPHDTGLLECRERVGALDGLADSSADYLKEGRTGKNILHKLISLLRQGQRSTARHVRSATTTSQCMTDRLSSSPTHESSRWLERPSSRKASNARAEMN